MPETATHTRNVVVNSTTYTFTETLSDSGLIRLTPSVPAAKSGTLTTRTDANTGTFTMSSGHGFSTSDVIDLYWSGGKRHGMTATVTGDSVVLDGGTGTDLPATSTAITASKPTEVAFAVDGDTLTLLLGSADVEGYIGLFDDTGTPVLVDTMDVASGESDIWTASQGETNPVAGHILTLAKFSHGQTSAKTMTLIGIA